LNFTLNGGRVQMRAGVVGGMAEVSLTTVIGIAPEDQKAVRQVGPPAAKKVEETGLGPALSGSSLELHGRRIWGESQVGVGLTFYVHAAAADARDREQ
jgi:signal transduction histidine kinase